MEDLSIQAFPSSAQLITLSCFSSFFSSMAFVSMPSGRHYRVGDGISTHATIWLINPIARSKTDIVTDALMPKWPHDPRASITSSARSNVEITGGSRMPPSSRALREPPSQNRNEVTAAFAGFPMRERPAGDHHQSSQSSNPLENREYNIDIPGPFPWVRIPAELDAVSTTIRVSGCEFAAPGSAHHLSRP